MAYRQPGIEVVQQFQALTPALVLPSLPVCMIGPAYQIQDNTDAGAYAGASKAFSWPSLVTGALVDIAVLNTDELASIQKPVSVKLTNAYVKLSEGTAGETTAGSQTFTSEATAAKDFSSVTLAVGKYFYVRITGAGTDAGTHLILTKTSNTVVKLANVMKNTSSAVGYKVVEKKASITYDRSNFSTVGITLTTTALTLPTDLSSSPTSATADPIDSADKTLISYRALRPDLADTLSTYTGTTSLQSEFSSTSIVPANPYAYGAYIALQNTSTNVYATGLKAGFVTDEATAYSSALEFLEDKEVYALVVLTQNTMVHGYLNTHTTGQSASGVGMERVGLINRKIILKTVVTPAAGTGYKTTAGVGNGTSGATNLTFKDVTTGDFITEGVKALDTLEITSYTPEAGLIRAVTDTATDSIAVAGSVATITLAQAAFTAVDVGRTIRIAKAVTAGNRGDYVISSITSATVAECVKLAGSANETNGTSAWDVSIYQGYITLLADVAGNSIVAATKTFTVASASFTAADVGRSLLITDATQVANNGLHVITSVTSGTVVICSASTLADETSTGDWIIGLFDNTLSAAQITYITGTRHVVTAAVSKEEITLTTDPTSGWKGRLNTVKYQVTRDKTKAEEATALAGYATSFANRRLVSVWPDAVYATVSNVSTEMPGYFACCALGGLIAGLPSQQGFTNMGITGFTGRKNSNDRYTRTQLNTIAGGGNCILMQDTVGAQLYVRHQLTTDTSVIQYQELSITKNVDLVAKFFRRLYAPFIGKYNITDALLDLLKTMTSAGLDFLVGSTAPRVGGVLRGGSIKSIGEDAKEPDTVNIILDISIPYPLNNIKVTLLV